MELKKLNETLALFEESSKSYEEIIAEVTNLLKDNEDSEYIIQAIDDELNGYLDDECIKNIVNEAFNNNFTELLEDIRSCVYSNLRKSIAEKLNI